jgi:hypothetical protein
MLYTARPLWSAISLREIAVRTHLCTRGGFALRDWTARSTQRNSEIWPCLVTQRSAGVYMQQRAYRTTTQGIRNACIEILFCYKYSRLLVPICALFLHNSWTILGHFTCWKWIVCTFLYRVSGNCQDSCHEASIEVTIRKASPSRFAGQMVPIMLVTYVAVACVNRSNCTNSVFFFKLFCFFSKLTFSERPIT